jgi:putative aminopeptidase FrvX
MKLLKQLCEIHAPSGEEFRVRDFIIDYVQKNCENWAQKPRLVYGDDYQDCLLMVFGKPRCAAMAHMDSIGFTAAYNNELVPIGSPAPNESSQIRNEEDKLVDVYFDNAEKEWKLKSDQKLEPGSTWTWRPGFKENSELVMSPFLDNRLGIYTLLQIAPQIKDTVIAFSTYEEMSKGGKAGFLARILYSNWDIRKILIADITWVTPYVKAGEGVAISLRDVGIPRKKFRDYIVKLANESGIPFQLEIEKAGGSDGTIIGASDYPIDWIFIGAPEENPHGHIEKVHKKDIESMIKLYAFLCEHL